MPGLPTPPPPPQAFQRVDKPAGPGFGDDEVVEKDEIGFLERASTPPGGGKVIGALGCEEGVFGGVSTGIARIGVTMPIEDPPLTTLLSARAIRVSRLTGPAKVTDVKPRYPPLARQLKIGGVVILDLTIDENGHVVDVEILHSVNLLDRAAVDAVRQWRFAPAIVNGRPMPVLMTVTVAFTQSPA